ncbi:hypothetical protein AB0K34_14125 [Actinomadura sp. NPDC049382]|uniref:hypothetical protein n=1 Tax=Actinomadura sp. NPDC049382 TaxID=3158220 RepID=UPI0034448922
MSAEQTPKQQDADTAAPRPSIEERVERTATYWGRALGAAWRTVLPPKKDR